MSKVDSRIRGHMPALDGVRGLAIAMVLAVHFVGDTVATNGLERGLVRISNYGLFGVDLFFVLSGFLITGILFDTKDSPHYFRTFYVRRALRIFPLYYAVLVCVFFVAPLVPWLAGPDLAAARAHQAWAWLYGVNVFDGLRGAYSLPYLDHFWSLAVEEHFYLFWPLVVWLCSRRSLLVVSAALAATSLATRALCAELHVFRAATEEPALALYVLTPFRLDALCLGGFLAVFARTAGGLDVLRRAATPMAALAIVTLVATYVFNRVTPTLFGALHEVRASCFDLGFGALLIAALTAEPQSVVARLFASGAARTFGKYSYGLYVFHHFASYAFIRYRTEFLVARWVGSHTLAVILQACVGLAVSLAVSIISYRFFESPLLALKRYFPAATERRETGPVSKPSTLQIPQSQVQPCADGSTPEG
jgi:peptidoglycan/LPS O-acetylase OafA/YrhL